MSAMKILVIDDEQVLTEVYSQVLEKVGHKALVANRVTDALEIAQKEKPDVIFLDMLMPEQDGIDFLKQYKSLKLPKAVILVLSNIDNEQVIVAAKKLGATDYLLKADYSPYQIVDAVKKYTS